MRGAEYIEAYERILTGYSLTKNQRRQKDFPRGCFSTAVPDRKKKEFATLILQYAFKNLLGWDADTCRKAINREILEDMKVDKIIKYLDVPEEYNGKIDPTFFASLIYPDKVRFDREGLVLSIYEDVCNGKIEYTKAGEPIKKGYPKKFFLNEEGRLRALSCIIYALQTRYSFSDIEEVYNLLSDAGKKFLKDNKLVLAEGNFETPVDFLHDALAEDQKDDFLFAYYKFKFMYDSLKDTQKTE